MSKIHIRFEPSKELQDETIFALEAVKDTGRIKKGTNETTKAIERGQAKFVVIAMDVDPPEVVAHIPELCNEKKVPYSYLPGRKQIGRACGIEVPAAAVAVTEVGNAAKIIKEIADKLETLGLK